jgi:type I restriction-modification system DNA methylase subunit
MIGDEENRVKALKELLGYPVVKRDPEGSEFWYLHPGEDEEEACLTCPIAVGFYEELNTATDQEIKRLFTSKEKQQEVYGHYSNREFEQQPVMYLLLPTDENIGRIPLVLPTEGGLRQRQIQTFGWNDAELIARLNRLKQEELTVATKALYSIPQVDWVFYEAAKTAGELASSLAEAARRIEQAIPKVFAAESSDGYLHKLLKSFQKELLPTLQLTSDNQKDYSFADIYAQTVAYGLFTARVFSYVRDKKEERIKETDFNRQDAWKQLPETNPFLRKLFEDVSQQTPEELGEELIGAISDIFGILRAAKMDAILSDFQMKMNREDIVIKFYEDFLAAYKPQMRERRGVYYTPEPVVSYIVKSVDHILKSNFGLADGLADATKVKVENSNGNGKTETHKVLITDVATGTGNFLYSVIEHIYNSLNFDSSNDSEKWSNYVSQHLLPRLLGFELLMAPYAVAHMKLGLQLAELGYKFDTAERLRVYLTNTLQEAFQIPPADDFDSWIRDEADAANKIKQEAPVMVLLGNPPYSGHSANKGDWISNLLKGKDTITNYKTSSYFEVDGKPLGEKNPKWLNDDYVKFIRFGQWRIEQTGYGVLAFITNHGYLDNPTFRGMRQSLMETFDDIYVLDLHGNSKKKEKCPDGSKDENVFDIQQGVAISIFVKRQNGKKQPANVYHADLFGLRDRKYQWLNENDLTTTEWTKLKPQSEFYLFVPQNTDLLGEYQQGWKITDVMPVNVLGFQTHRDHFAIDFDENSLRTRISDLRCTLYTDDEIREIYKLRDNRDWQVCKARKQLRNDTNWGKNFIRCLYRTFDWRSCYFSTIAMDYPRKELIDHVAKKENLCLLVPRQVRGSNWQHTGVADCIAESCAISNKTKEQNYNFPLYLYPNPNNPKELEESVRPNLSPKFLKDIKSKLGYTPKPEAIFYYIYAIFHSPTYRTRYAEFLKIDFPRVPLTSNKKLFQQLSEYGEELVALHLMKSPKLDNSITQFVENGGGKEVAIGAANKAYANNKVTINKKGDRFTGVPEEVWNFHVGGYQVCHKWLKDRKNRTLSQQDIQHYQRIVVALQETIKLMNKIDQAIPEFPIT